MMSNSINRVPHPSLEWAKRHQIDTQKTDIGWMAARDRIIVYRDALEDALGVIALALELPTWRDERLIDSKQLSFA